MTTAIEEGAVPVFTKGDRLRKARELTEMNQREFAKRIGVSHQTVTNAEKDHREVRKITINAWSLATRIPVEWLETGKAPTDDGGGNTESGRRDLNSQHSAWNVEGSAAILRHDFGGSTRPIAA